jgi:hypothetical protein
MRKYEECIWLLALGLAVIGIAVIVAMGKLH